MLTKGTLPSSPMIHFGMTSFHLKQNGKGCTKDSVTFNRNQHLHHIIVAIVILVKEETTSLFLSQIFQWGLIFVFMQQLEVDLETQLEREQQQMVYFYDKNLLFFLSLCRSLRNLQAHAATSMMTVSKFFLSTTLTGFLTSITLCVLMLRSQSLSLLGMYVGHRQLQFRPDLRNLFS